MTHPLGRNLFIFTQFFRKKNGQIVGWCPLVLAPLGNPGSTTVNPNISVFLRLIKRVVCPLSEDGSCCTEKTTSKVVCKSSAVNIP